MEQRLLTGIERELVLKYLVDGNVPVTVTPVDETAVDADEIRPLSSEVFSVSIEAANVSVLKEGIILLQNVPSSVSDLTGKVVKVEFYFNRVGLYFTSVMKAVSSGPAIVIPKEIFKIEDAVVEKKYDFSATLYYSNHGEVQFSCVPCDGIELFTRPVWSSIDLPEQQAAKEYLEKFVPLARKNGRAGNGVQLINICNYFVKEKLVLMEAVQGRVKPFDILFVNHERIVLGFEKNDALSLSEGSEYPLNMFFAMKEAPAVVRSVFVTGKIDTIYESSDGTRFAADCHYTSLKEEDCRFLYEKATSTLFI